MNFRSSKLKLSLSVAATLAMVLSVGAQQSGQPIVFSSPKNTDNSAGAPSLAPQNPGGFNLPDTLQASKQFFNMPNNSASPPPQSLSPDAQQRLKELEDQRNWALLTPEEILGATTPDNANSAREKRQTPLERFLNRQSQLRMSYATNVWQNANTNSPWNFSFDRQNTSPFGLANNALKNSLPSLNRFLDAYQQDKNSANQNEDSGWNIFGSQQQQQRQSSKSDIDQQAAMDRFRQLLGSGSASVAAGTPPPNNNFFSTPKPTPDPYFTQPAFVPNPVGASFTPLTSGIGRPTGLTPLPGIVTPPELQPVAAPAWAPQPAPWLSQEPQPFTIPQRKF